MGQKLDSLDAVVGKLPAEPERIRRRYWRDPEFRAVCADYQEAQDVLARLGRVASPAAPRLDEYRRLAAELLAEATDMLAEDGS